MRSAGAILLVVILSIALPSCNRPSQTSPPSSEGGAQSAPAAPGAAAAPAEAEKPASAQAGGEKRAPAAAPEKQAQHEASTMTVPAGTVLTVRLKQAVGSKISQTGESFSASLAEPLQINGTTVAPSGAPAEGTVAEAVPLGRFKGGARLRLTLDKIEIGGREYHIQTSSIARSLKGKGKRTAVLTGGGAGVGAVLGGILGGGKGAAIGAAAGAGAGGAGSAFTGNKDIVIPAEAALSFKLTEPLTLK